ncbi:putative aspartyl-tRNA synthetase [Talaromyces proteolyticus]|uniref:Aspartyl-tRNA synthetase n=1 Tax=Talaromyces proteolyticus TaxID=1131652 RepID=A0AAD4KKL9_9EURO|nr:putative aspartyl-tRNA synthetase [Talaromyces proteolyticus]KAH8693837.1 putative aspartyl-tRNA synthetase [Talaromyces proteolyticus]
MLAAPLRRGSFGLQTIALARRSYIEIANLLHERQLRGKISQSRTLPNRRNYHSRPPLRQQCRSIEEVSTVLGQYKSSVEFPSATHSFTDLLQNANSGDTVIIHGYLGHRADLSKKLSFVRITDTTMRQNIQIISSAKENAHQKLKSISANSPVAIRGTIQTKKGSTGEKERSDIEKIDSLEIQLEDIWPLNEFPKDIIMTPETVFPAEYRYLQLRSDRSLREALQFRSNARRICREELENCSPPFAEIETPLLFKSTPEGAREFLVPTRRKGFAYALPQSPQQYKQILMASGIPRYYQFARCFRDEDLRADRQPEFTQLDLEMSFATGEDVMTIIERVIRKLWSTLLDETPASGPFKRLSYQDAMSRFGSDKPDTRFGMEITRLDYVLPIDLVQKISPLTSPIVEAFKLPCEENDPAKTLDFITRFLDSPAGAAFNNNPDGGPGIFVYDAKKPLHGLMPFGFEAAERVEEILEPDHGDLIVLQARKNVPFAGGSTPLGDLRKALHWEAVKSDIKDAPTGFDFLWIVDFPLFSPTNENEPGQGGAAGLSSTHHPFTAPKSAADVDLLLTDPAAAVADHYDLVVNGVELGGGSRRIHDARVQEIVFREILQMPASRIADFSHLLEALRAGCPPHAGIALGFDRLIAVMLGKESVRDVIAFPKTGKGEDVMVGSPSEMSEELLATYHLRLRQ